MKGHRQWAFSLPPISSSSSSPSSSSASCASSASHYYHHASGRPAPHHSRLRSSCILSLSSCPSTGHSPRRNGRRRRGRRFLACPVRDRRTRGTGEGCVPEHSPSLLTWFPAFSPFSVRPSLYNSFSCMYNVSSSFCSSSSPKLRSFLHASTSSRTNLFSSSRGVRLSSSSPPRSSHTSSSSSTFLSLRNHLPLKPCRFFSLSPSCYSFSSFSSSHSIPGEQPGPKSDGGRRAWGEEEDEKEKSTGGSENTEWSIEKRTKKEKEKKESTGGEFACSFSLSSAKNPRLSDEEYVRKLGDELHAIDTEKLLPDRMQYLHKERLLAILGPLLKQHTGGSLIPFGSCANGFWKKHTQEKADHGQREEDQKKSL
ncbi:polynucleotide adenylyltransferase, partial [Cystoisospora suis]